MQHYRIRPWWRSDPGWGRKPGSCKRHRGRKLPPSGRCRPSARCPTSKGYSVCARQCSGSLFVVLACPSRGLRWVRLTFSSLCPIYSKQRRQQITATTKNPEIFGGNARNQTGAAWWEARMLDLCYAALLPYVLDLNKDFCCQVSRWLFQLRY